jgi:hypothetical protein
MSEIQAPEILFDLMPILHDPAKIQESSPTIIHSITMADDASYLTFLQKANRPPAAPSSASETTASSLNEPTASKHPLVMSLNKKLANLSSKTLISETDEDFRATYIPSSVLPSWSSSSSAFPAAGDLESQVDGGRNAEMTTVEEWDSKGRYSSLVDTIKEITKQNELKVYTVDGRGGRYEVFILAKIDDGLIGVKAKGVAT